MESDAIDHVKKIWLLLQVVETGSFRKAASRAKVSAPAVSQAIAALERFFGKPLVIRKESGVVPTDEARSIVEEAGPALRALLHLSALKGSQTPDLAWIAFGTYESLAVDILPTLTRRFRELLPKTKVTVRVARTAALAAMVRKGELCSALVTESDCFGDLLAIPVGEDRLGFFAKKGDFPKSLSLEDLRRQSVGHLSPGAEGYPLYFKRFLDTSLGERFKPSIMSDSFEALKSTAVGGQVICLLPERVAARNPSDLTEILLPQLPKNLEGRHQILLLSEPKCDPAEVHFLERELRSLLALRPRFPVPA